MGKEIRENWQKAIVILGSLALLVGSSTTLLALGRITEATWVAVNLGSSGPVAGLLFGRWRWNRANGT